jgi:hypothetical protein
MTPLIILMNKEYIQHISKHRTKVAFNYKISSSLFLCVTWHRILRGITHPPILCLLNPCWCTVWHLGNGRRSTIASTIFPRWWQVYSARCCEHLLDLLRGKLYTLHSFRWWQVYFSSSELGLLRGIFNSLSYRFIVYLIGARFTLTETLFGQDEVLLHVHFF